jgi:hypothetical protein
MPGEQFSAAVIESLDISGDTEEIVNPETLSTLNASSTGGDPSASKWLLDEASTSCPMNLGSLKASKGSLALVTVSTDMLRSIPRLQQVPMLVRFRIELVSPDAVMGLSRSERRFLMKDLSNVFQRVHVATTDGLVLSKRKLFGVNGSDLSNSSILALSFALRSRPQTFAELLGVSPPSVLKELQPFCVSPLIRCEHIPRFVHAVARSILHRHANPRHPADIATLAGDVVSEIMIQSGSGLDGSGANQLLSGFLDVIRAQRPDDAGMHIGLMKCGVVKYIKRSRDKMEKKLKVVQEIIDCTLGGLTTVPVGGVVPAILAPSIHAQGERVIKAKVKKWDDLQAKMEAIIQNEILGQLSIYKTYIPRRNEKDEIVERIQVNDREKFESGYKLALDYNSVPYIS